MFATTTRRIASHSFSRAFSTAAAPKKSGAPFLAVAGLAGAGGYYYYTQQNVTAVKKKIVVENPVPALTGANEFKPFVLDEIIPLTHNTSTFRFKLPESTTELGLPTASCIVAKYVKGQKPDGKPDVIIRPYTPAEDPAEGYTGHFDLIVKKYPNGPMSSHIFSLKKGDSLLMKGPIPKYQYESNKDGHIGMIAGGTGITPMLQVIQRIFSNPADKTKVSLIFANVTEKDIILKDYLDGLAKKYPDQFKLFYTLDKPPAGWTLGSGFINEDMIQKNMPAPGKGKVFICGPSLMLNHVSGSKAVDFSQGEVGGLLKKLGYTTNDVFKF
ncbi:hypothetical protein HDV05_006985 [Chytridiales sp. JEL 0842]|nr:hypothetical protein HDV05_006985 [Chytridiales sp. JEL 0842]